MRTQEPSRHRGFRFRIHHDLRLVYKKVWGSYGDEQSVASHTEWDRICRTEPAVGDYNELQDLTQVTEYDVSIDQIRALAERYEEAWKTGEHQPKRLAYVVPSPLAYGTGRVYGSLMATTGITFRVFNSLPDATQWLALSEGELRTVVETV